MEVLNLVKNDRWLELFNEFITKRHNIAKQKEQQLLTNSSSLSEFASGYLYFGLHKINNNWVLREWAPNATELFIIGDFNNWKPTEEYKFNRIQKETWELVLPNDKLKHGDLFKLFVIWPEGKGERIPAYIRRVVQDEHTKIFCAQVWWPSNPYEWKIPEYKVPGVPPLIYEAHVGMATSETKVGTFKEFTLNVLPRIAKSGYNTVQLMAIQEHPYYGSFGYHVSSFYAPSSRFGTPEDLKELIDTAHILGLTVVMDLVHSHSVKNETEGLNTLDGSPYQYFHDGPRRNHPAWDSLCFNYSKNEVIHFLLSNCKYWLEEFHFDGFRFDGITSMLYLDHGLSKDFTEYKFYFDNNEDEDAITYLILANKLIHQIKPDAITIAEEMSGMPGTGTPFEDGGMGFDYRLAMGTPDYWIKIIKEIPDEKWDVGELFYELTRKRHDEKTIGYSESHDQAMVGDKTLVFRLMDKEIYSNMHKNNTNLIVDRAMALHKMIRLITIATTGNGYLNFMGNEFGHPEWIDFPREGNNWSYNYARRQWNLVDNKQLKFHYLADFDIDMLNLIKEYQILEDSRIYLQHENKSQQILAFKRRDILFIFNFNPDKSFKDYGICTDVGKYEIILNTDSPKFGGNGFINEELTYYTLSTNVKKMINNVLKIYIPARCGIALRKIQSKSVYDLD